MHRTRLALLLLLLPVLLLAGACGDDAEVETGSDPGATDGGDPAPDDGTDATQVAISIEVGGGFVPFGYDFAGVPTVVLDDGTAFTGGAVIDIYPGPALTPVATGVLAAGELDALLEQAEALGLATDDELDVGRPNVADTPTTTITVRVDGRSHDHAVFALGFGEEAGAGDVGLTDEQLAARTAISAFVQEVHDAVAVAATDLYDPVAFDVLPQPLADAGTSEDVLPNQLDWPFSYPVAADGSCMRLEGDDAVVFAALLPRATQITEWTDRSTGAQYRITARAAIPGYDRAC